MAREVWCSWCNIPSTFSVISNHRLLVVCAVRALTERWAGTKPQGMPSVTSALKDTVTSLCAAALSSSSSLQQGCSRAQPLDTPQVQHAAVPEQQCGKGCWPGEHGRGTHLLASLARSLSSTLRPSCTVPPNPVAWQNILRAQLATKTDNHLINQPNTPAPNSPPYSY